MWLRMSKNNPHFPVLHEPGYPKLSDWQLLRLKLMLLIFMLLVSAISAGLPLQVLPHIDLGQLWRSGSKIIITFPSACMIHGTKLSDCQLDGHSSASYTNFIDTDSAILLQFHFRLLPHKNLRQLWLSMNKIMHTFPVLHEPGYPKLSVKFFEAHTSVIEFYATGFSNFAGIPLPVYFCT